jgi:ATP-binding cassette, subfamily B, bacterial
LLPDLDRGFLAMYLRPHRPRLVLLGVLFVGGTFLQLANPLIAKSIIDRAAAGAAFDSLVSLAGIFLAVAVLAQVAAVAETFVAEDLGWRTTNALRVDLTHHVLRLDHAFHTEHPPGELVERIDGDVSAIAAFFARFVVYVLGSAAFLVGVLALLWREDARIGALLTAVAVVALLYLLRGGRFVARRSRAAREVEGELSSYLEERLTGLVDIKANGADGFVAHGLDTRLAERHRAGRHAILGASLYASAVYTFLVAGTAASLVTSVVLLRSGALTVGGVFVVFRYARLLRTPLERLSRHMNSFQRAAGAIVRVREVLDVSPEVEDAGRVELPDGPLAVELDDVRFAYGDRPVLDKVSLVVAPGEVVGLLGRTGAGKSTIVRLLCRLYDADEGSVRVGGVDVRDVPLDELRRRVAFVTQDVQLFAGTLRDNVRLFDPAVADDRIIEAFAALGIGSWLDALPDGIDTVVGAGGLGLSAGEAQLVALARVFLANPGVVLLDEASSRLDPHTEELLHAAMRSLLTDRTGVVIAHRLGTVATVDAIAIVDGGAIVEHGPRSSLAADATSRYARLLRAGEAEVVA